ncbi:uncharacterized protein [Macrobrachium rosenbergii]|uniref:uncharacterized protein n=1 Tax=Macrobrachium rosenbergii TaxID=79674 RepID=UPI0034D53E8E
MEPNKTLQSKNLVAQESVFGWVLSGSCNIPLDRVSVTSQLLCVNDVSESDLHKFWDLESVGISSKEAVSNEFSSSTVLQKFSDNVKFIDGRYEVSLPWKSDVAKQSLKNNEKLARKRLENLNLKFVKTPGLRERYDEVFEEYEKHDIIEEVPHSEISSVYPVYYLPHRAVIHESSNSTKVRPVFDASAVSYNSISLNDCLECGPSLNPDLVEVLIRFRRWKVALTADITKAFLQIKVLREDQDVHRFLWQNKGIARVMRFVRVPFGNKSSPFLLNATIKHHLKSHPNSEVVDELNYNLYVDDCLSGADSTAEACVKFDKACKILSEAGKDNPADLISRGVFAEHLVASDLWLVGPPWLQESESLSLLQPEQLRISLRDESSEENVVACINVDSFSQVFEYSRWKDEGGVPCIVSEVNDKSVPKPVYNHSDMNADDSDPEISQSRVEPISYARRGRLVKAPVKLDLLSVQTQSVSQFSKDVYGLSKFSPQGICKTKIEMKDRSYCPTGGHRDFWTYETRDQ